ncbi:MAG: biopolymer transporter ExbD [Deltaproteobacteria bacterium]|nr:biopolymer transporter ExbD [Deltaproteobacteria bacterium]
MAGMRPSRRRHHRKKEFELELIPVISLLCVLIPIMLQGAAFVRTAGQEVNLPSTDEVRYVGQAPAEAGTLTLALSDRGFTLGSGDRILSRIPKLPSGAYDFAILGQTIREAKQRAPSQSAIVLLIGDRILYEDIIHAMDECRPYFPSIAMADRVETVD